MSQRGKLQFPLCDIEPQGNYNFIDDCSLDFRSKLLEHSEKNFEVFLDRLDEKCLLKNFRTAGALTELFFAEFFFEN